MSDTADPLKLYDAVIKEQVKLGIVEQVPNQTQFMTENPTASFLPHMGVFKLDRKNIEVPYSLFV